MRIIIAIIIWVVFVGGLFLFMEQRNDRRTIDRLYAVTESSEKKCVLEIITTFTPEPDPFALNTNPGDEADALIVRQGDRDILRIKDAIEPGVPVRSDILTEMKIGINEYYIEACAPLDSIGRSFAMRVQCICNGQMIADRTFWTESGNRAAGTLRVNLE